MGALLAILGALWADTVHKLTAAGHYGSIIAERSGQALPAEPVGKAIETIRTGLGGADADLQTLQRIWKAETIMERSGEVQAGTLEALDRIYGTQYSTPAEPVKLGFVGYPAATGAPAAAGREVSTEANLLWPALIVVGLWYWARQR